MSERLRPISPEELAEIRRKEEERRKAAEDDPDSPQYEGPERDS